MWVNEVKVGGRIAKKFELKTAANGTPWLSFTVHSSKEKKQQYTPCVAFGDSAIVINDAQPDAYITVEGEISTKGIDNQATGKKDYRTNVVAHKVTLG